MYTCTYMQKSCHSIVLLPKFLSLLWLWFAWCAPVDNFFLFSLYHKQEKLGLFKLIAYLARVSLSFLSCSLSAGIISSCSSAIASADVSSPCCAFSEFIVTSSLSSFSTKRLNRTVTSLINIQHQLAVFRCTKHSFQSEETEWRWLHVPVFLNFSLSSTH